MKIYLVGGAVRDKLLDYPFKERDWVVVGASPDELLSLGYRQVGKDFPVFLHPVSKDEYALARTERKSGKGYTGFDCYSGPEVTLEEDLLRRDLTINAMAEDSEGRIIDPYGGQQDLENRVLRHVSAAFSEDPLRVLRIARFAARYAHLGFRVADETMTLMRQIAASGELEHLVAERLWRELERALSEQSPQVFFEILRECGALAVILPELDRLFGIPQTAAYHPEIDCGIHSLMCLEQAALLSEDLTVRFAALIHDLGKGLTPPAILPKHIGHERKGLKVIEKLCQRIRAPKEFLQLALLTAEYHTHSHRAMELKPATVMKLFKSCDAMRRPERFQRLLLSCEADSKGRLGKENNPYPQADYLWACLQACIRITPADLSDPSLKGKELGEALHQLRIAAIKQQKDSLTDD
jgi:tRNA nucleotidyltransferase (CCA-adding enzyme)